MHERKVMIVNVGGTDGPIIFSLSTHRPNFIYFIPSRETEHSIPSIIEKAFPKNNRVKYESFPVENADDLLATYKACQKAFIAIKALGLNNNELLADITGGTKVMSAGLALAAANQGVQMVYVAGLKRTKDGVGTVENGTEFVISNSHPYEVTAKQEIESFCNNFNSHRFAAAIYDCEKIVGKGNQTLKDIFGAIKDICEAYRYWDLFNYKTAVHYLEMGVNKIQKLLIGKTEIQRLLGTLPSEAAGHLKRLKTIMTDKLSIDLVEELVANACRRADEGKYDDAVARLYRAHEMLAQVRFIKIFGKSTSNFPLSLLSPEVRTKKYPNKSREDTIDIGCKNAYEVLFLSGDDIGKIYTDNEQEICKLLSARNYSILAHGINPLDKNAFEKFLGLFHIFGINYSKTKFPQIDPELLSGVGLVEVLK